MKKLVLGFLAFLMVAVSVQAQDAKDLWKDAQKAFNRYNLDPTNNKADLKEAKQKIDEAVQVGEGKTWARVWNTKGEIYNEIAIQVVTVRQLGMGDASELPQVDNPALVAFEAFANGLKYAEKGFEEKDAIKGLQTVQPNLSNLGVFHYEDQKFEGAYKSFKAVIDAHKLLKEKGEESTLDAEEEYHNQMYITGLAALNANSLDKAKPYFEELYNMNYDKPSIYEAMYKIEAQESSPEAAYKYLQKGRERYPEDVTLLFADINHALQTGQLDALLGKLQDAIQKEPNNVTLYTTTGSVYDQLYQKAVSSDDEEKAQEYFDKAMENFNKALEINEDNFDAIYSIGTLYYNKAAAMTQDLQKLADDYSKEGIEKYEALKEKIFAEFDRALPYFQRCEKLDPNDVNTLIALKEIYARKDNLEVSNEFKKRLETVQSGGTNENSYFKTNQK
jgi:tetratricopeptide (TPR) repeat protein